MPIEGIDHIQLAMPAGQARKAHPGSLVRELPSLVDSLRQSGIAVTDEPKDGFYRVYVSDPFGNRLELMEQKRD